jgi:hypothetical protein
MKTSTDVERKALALEKQLYEKLFDMLLPHLADLQQAPARWRSWMCWLTSPSARKPELLLPDLQR